MVQTPWGGWGGLETGRDDADSRVSQLSESPLLCHLPRHQEQRGWGPRVAEGQLVETELCLSRSASVIPRGLGSGPSLDMSCCIPTPLYSKL